MAGQSVKTRLLDVTGDPDAPRRARIPPSLLAEANAVGFSIAGWSASVIAASETDPALALVMPVLVRPDRGSNLAIWSHGGPGYALYTLFEDGAIAVTESKAKGWYAALLRWGPSCFYTKGSRVDFEFFDSATMADLVARHGERVRALRARGAIPIAHHDLRAHLAMKLRTAEIRIARMTVQVEIAFYSGVAALVATVIACISIANVIGVTVVLALIFGVLVALPISYGAYLVSLYVVAPLLSRAAKVPSPRSAADLLREAASVPSCKVPPEGL